MLPYSLGKNENPAAVVAVKKDSGTNIILPLAVYDDSGVKFFASQTGSYDLIYNACIFNDTAGHWAANYISFTTAREIFNGTGGDVFHPGGTMTRAMFVMALANLDRADLSAYTASRFSDVPTGVWYAAAVEWAADNGIASSSNGRFSPNIPITREEMAVMLVNYTRYKGYAMPASGAAAVFADKDSISAWAIEAVKAMRSMGIINGKPGNLFDPQATATRAEAATIFARFVERIKATESTK